MAGAGFVEHAHIHNQPSSAIQLIRRFRGVALASAAVIALGTFAVTGVLLIQNVRYISTLSRDQDRGQLTLAERKACDSIKAETDRRITADSLVTSRVCWSKRLTALSSLSHSRVSIDRLESRTTDTGVELAFAGEGTSHPAVTDFIDQLKSSDQFGSVQLLAFDRSGQKGYRFTVQCLAK